MALNWLEEVVSQLYKLRGYIVLENEDFPMPDGVGGRAEADIMAFKDGKLLQIECEGWWGYGTANEQEAFDKLNSKFLHAQNSIFNRYSFLEQYKPIIKTFVAGGRVNNPRPDGPWNRLQAWCNDNDIELIEINSVIEDLIRELRLRRENPDPLRVGEKGISQFLLHLILNDFLKRPQE